MSSYGNLCTGCFKVITQGIHEDTTIDGKQFSAIINEVCNVEVDISFRTKNNLPHKMCVECTEQLQSTYSFLKKLNNSHTIIENWSANLGTQSCKMETIKVESDEEIHHEAQPILLDPLATLENIGKNDLGDDQATTLPPINNHESQPPVVVLSDTTKSCRIILQPLTPKDILEIQNKLQPEKLKANDKKGHIKCLQCLQTCKSYARLIDHMMTHYKRTQDIGIACRECKKTFTDEEFRAHVESHLKEADQEF